MNPDDARVLLTRLLHRIAPEADLGTVDPDSSLQQELDLDSMDFLHMVTALHEETGIDVPEADYGQLDSVNGFARYVSNAQSP